MNKVFIILLNYNNYENTEECVKSIINNENKINYEIIVVDNCSTDNSRNILNKNKNIKLICNDKNDGFSSGNNVGIKYAIDAGAEYILLLNNDTIITTNAIYNMYKTMNNHDDVSIMGSRIMYYDKPEIINYYGGSINMHRGTVIMENYKKEFDYNMKQFNYATYITGCCMLIKKEVFETIGFLPEEYFMYYEDVDFCLSAVNNGFKLGVTSDSVIYHKASSASGGEGNPFAIKWNTRNRLIFMKKYKFNLLSFLFFYITRVFVGIKYLCTGKNKCFNAMIDGIKMGKKNNRQRS